MDEKQFMLKLYSLPTTTSFFNICWNRWRIAAKVAFDICQSELSEADDNIVKCAVLTKGVFETLLTRTKSDCVYCISVSN